MKPDPRLTWSLCFRSGSWGGSAPPCQCGDRWAGSLFGCSGSAVPLPGSSGSFLFGDSGQWLQTCNVFFRTAAQNASRLVWSHIWNSKTYHCWWPGKPGAPRERWGRFCCTCLSSLQLKKKLRKKGWRFSSESCLAKLETRWKCHFVSCVFCFSFLGSAICCCLNPVLNRPAFIPVLEMSHFPGCSGLRKMGLSTGKREFTQAVKCLNESKEPLMQKNSD